MSERATVSRQQELRALGVFCIVLAFPNLVGLWNWSRPEILEQLPRQMTYGRLAWFLLYAGALVVVGIGLTRRNYYLGYVGGLVFGGLALLNLVVTIGQPATASIPHRLMKMLLPLALVVLLPTRYRSEFRRP
jgi:hypothetical protein